MSTSSLNDIIIHPTRPAITTVEIDYCRASSLNHKTVVKFTVENDSIGTVLLTIFGGYLHLSAPLILFIANIAVHERRLNRRSGSILVPALKTHQFVHVFSCMYTELTSVMWSGGLTQR